ncbi:hypothetical protein Tco_1123386 [Tanacetum coccineum]|uniref:Integrase, catalytic region, zinc finger, CCHC-type, peptidase aspartic, catalytic n=1 Tax=Tanacetum coccineum TaxID=301880 RepID=A0ABQ5J375_9ASTR
MAAFCVIIINLDVHPTKTQSTWDYDSQMTEKYFAEYTGIEVKQFRETLLLHMGNVKKSVAERTRHKRQYDRRMNERQMQSRESKVVSSKALDASLVVTECSGTKCTIDSEVQLTAAQNVLANEQQHTDQSKPSYDTYLLEKVDSNTTPDSTNMSHRGGEIDQDAEQDQVKSPLLKAEFLKTNDMDAPEFCEFFEINDLKAHLQAKTTLICNLKNQIKSVKEASNEAKVKNDIDVIVNIELEHSIAKLLAANEQLHKENEHLKQTYKELYDSIKKTRVQNKDISDSLISQINQKSVENADLKAQIQEKVFANAALKNELRKLKGNSVDTKFAKPLILRKPVLQLPRNQSVVRQPNAFKSERPNVSKPRFASGSHNHFLEEAKKKTQDKNWNLKPREMPSARTHHTPNASTPKPMSNNQMFRNCPASKSSNVNLNVVQKSDHSRNPSSCSDSKHLVCSTCQKCVFNANHDNCIIKFQKEVNSRAKVQSPKTRNNKKPIEPKSHTHKLGRQIAIGQRFSLNKSFAMHEKPNTPRSCLRWKPTGRIFKTAGLRWIPTEKMFTNSTTKVNSEPPNGSNDDITNPYECDQTLNVSVETRGSRNSNVMNMNKVYALSSKEEKSSCFRPFSSTFFIFSHARSIIKWIDISFSTWSLNVYEMVKLTPGYISSGLVQNSVSLTTYVPPSKRDYEIMFQPLFDEYFNPPPCAISPDSVAVAAPRPVDPAGAPSSTTIDQDVPFASTSPTNQEIQSQVTHQGVEEQIHGHQNAQFNNAPLLHNLSSDPSSEETTLQGVIPSNLNHLNQSFDTLPKLTKNHPLENVIGDPSRPLWKLLNEDEACLTIKFNNFPKVQVKDLEVHDVSNDEENKTEAVVAEKQARYVQTNLTLSSAELEIQSMVDVPIHQEDLAVQRTPLIDPVISMVTEKTASTPTPPTTQAHVQMCSTSCWKDISKGV